MARRIGQWVAVLAIVASVVAFAPAPAVAAPATPSPVITDTQTLVAPEAGVTNFGNSSTFLSVPRVVAMDETRAVVPADLNGSRVAYVFDRANSGSWSHSATIAAPSDASDSWGTAISVQGSLLAIADPFFEIVGAGVERYGRVQILELQRGVWGQTQVLTFPTNFSFFGGGVWLSTGGLVVRDLGYCDASCSHGWWHFFERSGGTFTESFSRLGAQGLSVGVDGSRVAVGRPGAWDTAGCDPKADNNLFVADTATRPATVLVDETLPNGAPFCTEFDQWFRRVDLSGDVLAFEVCCSDNAAPSLHIRRFDGTSYVPEAEVPSVGLSGGLAAVPGALLRADVGAGVFHTNVYDGDGWPAGADVPLPADTDARTPVVASADRVALVGDEAVHILTIAAPKVCKGKVVTVDLSIGQRPTSGSDVIAGTSLDDRIYAGDGDDVVCGFGGNDVVFGGRGQDVVFGGDGSDVLMGGFGVDVLLGESGDDWLLGQSETDVLIGGDGADILIGGGGDDWLLGFDGADALLGSSGNDYLQGGNQNDALDGGSGVDQCHGEADIDTATLCETVTGVP